MNWQEEPDWQQVGPLHPLPPHCPHLAAQLAPPPLPPPHGLVG